MFGPKIFMNSDIANLLFEGFKIQVCDVFIFGLFFQGEFLELFMKHYVLVGLRYVLFL